MGPPTDGPIPGGTPVQTADGAPYSTETHWPDGWPRSRRYVDGVWLADDARRETLGTPEEWFALGLSIIAVVLVAIVILRST